MKKQFWIIGILTCVLATTGCTVEGGWVDTRPVDVVYTRPASPGADYVWIDGDWAWSGGVYTWREGRWSRPRGARNWEGGRWESAGNRWRWHRGHWR